MTTLYRIPPRVIHTRTPRGGVLLDPESKTYFELNAAGDVLWRTLGAAPTDRDALVDALCREFEVRPDVAKVDVDAWLTELTSLRLLEVVAGSDDVARSEDVD